MTPIPYDGEPSGTGVAETSAFVCPACSGRLTAETGRLVCAGCGNVLRHGAD